MFKRKVKEPARLYKQETIEVPVDVVIVGSLVSALIFAILGITFYHYGVFL